MNSTFVVDTNVPLVAGGKHADVSDGCVAACAQRLKAIVDSGRIALDAHFEILGEYQNKITANRGNGPDTAFVKWVLRNMTNSARCDLVHIERDGNGDYVAFPKHPHLATFDSSDKKFVAVSLTHTGHPPILEAADSKWLDWAPALNENGIIVDFLCKDDLESFQKKKAKQ